MTEQRTTPPRAWMIKDMSIRGRGDKAQKAHIPAIRDFAGFLEHSLDTALPVDLRAYQPNMTDAWIAPKTFNARIVTLKFFFGIFGMSKHNQPWGSSQRRLVAANVSRQNVGRISRRNLSDRHPVEPF